MRVIVLGGTRFIGRAIVGELVAHGHEPLLVHRGESEPEELASLPHLHSERAQLAGLAAELRAFGAEAAVDTYAMTREDAEAALVALPSGLRLTVLSSIDVYRAFASMNANVMTDATPIDERAPLREERYPYRGQDLPGYDSDRYEKLDVEEAYRARGATVCRLPFVYGEHDHRRREEFVLRRVRAGRTRIPVGAGTWRASKAYVGDVGAAVRLAIESAAAGGEIFNLAEERAVAARAWVEQILAAAGSQAQLVQVPDDVLPDDMEWTRSWKQDLVIDSSRARTALGWRDTPAAEAVTHSVEWHLRNPPQEPDPGFSDDDRALAAML